MAHGDTIPLHPVISSPQGEKSDDAYVPRGTTTVGENSVKVDPSTKNIGCPTSLDGTRTTGMDEFDTQALREAMLASAKAVDMVNAMVSNRLSCARDAQNMSECSEELMARAGSRKRKERPYPK
eukprot:6467791-Amphidinium_carterae.1